MPWAAAFGVQQDAIDGLHGEHRHRLGDALDADQIVSVLAQRGVGTLRAVPGGVDEQELAHAPERSARLGHRQRGARLAQQRSQPGQDERRIHVLAGDRVRAGLERPKLDLRRL